MTAQHEGRRRMKRRSTQAPKRATQPEPTGSQAADDGGSPTIGRRRLFQLAGGATAAAVATNTMTWAASPAPAALAAPSAQSPDESRREVAYRIRHEAALNHYSKASIEHPTNGDEARYPKRIGS